jgi:hypothetical protein
MLTAATASTHKHDATTPIWTNRTSKDATIKRRHDDTHEQLRSHLQLFANAYNHARRLKTLRGLTPNEFTHQTWTKEPERFRLDPSHHTPGPNT